jgi:CO/xanthine dehydrogenase Mo-binding subunit
MTKFGSSQSVTRLEDTRFLTGQGRYIDDVAPEGSLRGYRQPASSHNMGDAAATEPRG